MRLTGNMPGQDRFLHALNRVSFGPRPLDLARIKAEGIEQYIHWQLYPEKISVPGELSRELASYWTLGMSPLALFVEYWRPVMAAQREKRNGAGKDPVKQARLRARIVVREASQARLARAILSPRQLEEVMVAFWFNHFNVFAGKGLDEVWTASFEETAIRPHALGNFRALLGATAHHPAMLFYLDNWQNTAPDSPGSKGKFEGINENYARELMELHTLGVNGGYTQTDVIALAHILTGWGFPKPRQFPGGDDDMRGGGFFRRRRRGMPAPAISPSGFYFDPERHDFSNQTLLGRTIRGGGEVEGEQALDLLARHPSTAGHISSQLAQYFVSDNPPAPLVHRMAARFQESDGDIRGVLETLFTSPEFWDRDAFGAKFKTPYEYVISAVRATGTPVRNYRPLLGTMALLGMPLYGCLTPNGYSNTMDAWLNPDAMMIRLSFATGLGTGNLPLMNAPFEEVSDSGRGGKPKVVTMRENGTDTKIVPDAEASMAAPGPRKTRMTPPNEQELSTTLGGYFTATTAGAIESGDPRLRAALILGSPEFMKR